MLATEDNMITRKQRYVTKAHPAQDGDGVKINRIAGKQLNPYLDPFLMIDEINSDDEADYIGGFPPHPHRGFETLTYMRHGTFHHKDSMGNKGVISSGGLQWMSAASGVIHSEMPELDAGRMHGFQLWLNLPSEAKMKAPQYRDINAEDFPIFESEGSKVKVLVGEHQFESINLKGPLVRPEIEAGLLDLEIAPHSEFEMLTKPDHQVSVYVYEGQLNDLGFRHLGVFGEGDRLQLSSGDSSAKALIISGKALREPIVQYGPFVMNTMEEINQAIEDYQAGRLVSTKLP